MNWPSIHTMWAGWLTHVLIGYSDGWMVTLGFPLEWPNSSPGRQAIGPISLTHWPTRDKAKA
jgi:hypothetical protein